jgi:peptide/nickel transport system substrate-binding protein
VKRETTKLCLLPLLWLAACANPNRSPPDTITTIIGAPVQSLNPIYATDANSQHINELVHSGLVTISDKLVPEPYLAQEFHFAKPNVLEFTLRKGCHFENGREVHSDDVEKSLKYFIDPKNNSPHSETMKRIKKFERLDDYRFRFVLDKPSLSLVTDLELLKIMQLDGTEGSRKPASIPGIGPYRLDSLEPGLISLSRANTGCLPVPPMPKIKIKVVRDDLSRYLKLERGELDIVLNEMNFRKAELIEKNPGGPLAVASSEGIGYSYLGINMSNKKLQDPRVREALALTLDLPSLIQYKSRGMASQARNLLADFNFYANQNVPTVQRNLVKARQLLDEAGFSNGTNGKPPLHLTLKTTTAITSVENARVIVAQAQESGIEIEHQAFEWGIFYSDVKTGNVELYQLRWVGVTDPRIYFEVFHSGEIGRSNRTRYKNSEMDQWIEKGEATVSPKERKQFYDKVQEIAAKDLPFVGLWYGKNVAVYRKELKNVTMPPTGSWKNFLAMRKE